MHSSLILFGLVIAAATPPADKFLSFDLKKRPRSARSHMLKRDNDFDDDLTNSGAYYTIDLSFGSQLVSHGVFIDTGSADLWVARGIFDPTQSTSFTNLTQDFSICYADGECDYGYFGKDTIQVGGHNITQAQFAVVDRDDEGTVLGIGYRSTYDTFPYDLKNNGLIDAVAYSIWLNNGEPTGKIIFGGVDSSKFQGSLLTVPTIKFDDNGDPSALTVVCNGVSYLTANNADFIDVVTNAGLGVLLDTGTTTTSLPKSWLLALAPGLGAVWDDTLKALVATEIITEGSIVFDFSGIQILFPLSRAWEQRTVNGDPYKVNGTLAYSLKIEGSDDESNVIFGDAFLQNAYVVFDLDTREIAIAQAQTSQGDANITPIGTDGIPGATKAPRYSSTSTFTSFDATTPTALIGTPTTPAS